ncbi:MipA/OmpV family protein [Polaromonas sp. YR568]|uniref:MipA/OmpV family protein n=1 Tax=Polaromonas sp. YR568 TaxID=1855301 RepID=UPI00398C2160
MKRRSVVVPAAVVLLSALTGAYAQPGPEPGASPWGLGLGVAARTDIYAGESAKLRAVPLVSYQGEKFFWRGISGGYHLLDRDGFTLDATLGVRFGGIKKEDYGTAELAARGINRNLLEDRDRGLDLGISGAFKGTMGVVELALKADVSGASKGYEASARYGYPMQWGTAMVTPHVAVSHYSSKLANYYYGTLDAEVARGVVNYKPGSAVIPRIGVDLMQPFAGKWMLTGGLSYSALPGKIRNSPLVDKDAKGVTSVFVGVSRKF